jgi:hypothetical protein
MYEMSRVVSSVFFFSTFLSSNFNIRKFPEHFSVVPPCFYLCTPKHFGKFTKSPGTFDPIGFFVTFLNIYGNARKVPAQYMKLCAFFTLLDSYAITVPKVLVCLSPLFFFALLNIYVNIRKISARSGYFKKDFISNSFQKNLLCIKLTSCHPVCLV